MRRIVPLYWTGRLIFILSLFISTAAYSQRTVTGVVIDDVTGDPMIGATILVKGTTVGTSTDLDGKYSIDVPGSDAILVFSYVGSETQEIVVGNQQVINVRLLLSTRLLDELVVIGYGTVKKSDLTGSVAVVTSENLNRTPASTIDKALQGKAAGVLVTQTSGKPLEGISIRVRGIGSINGGSDPIYVVDGVITGSITNINPNDIESMQILKDASAGAIYGADGANGVVILTTKRGKSGKTQVSYSSYGSINRVPKKLDIMNADEYADFYNKLMAENGQQPEMAYTDGFRQFYYGDGWEKGTDWQDAIVRTGYSQNHYLNVSGGNDQSNFSISTGYYKEQGILRKTGGERYNLRANSDFKIGKYIKVGETVNISRLIYQDAGSQQGGAWQVSTITSPLMKIYNPDNKEGFEGPQIAYDYTLNDTVRVVNNTGGNDKPNPRGELDVPDYKRYATNVMASLYAEVKPVDWLTYKITPSVEIYSGRTNQWLPAYEMGVRSNARASLLESTYEGTGYSLENQLSFNKTFGDHTIAATGVYQVRGTNSTNLSVTGRGYNYEQLRVISQASDFTSPPPTGGIGEFRMLSSLARVIYDYKGKYLLTGSIRKDGVSRFGPKNRYGVFPSFSVAWKLNEDLLQNVEQINMLKVRFGWGKTGNSAINRDFGYDDYLDGTDAFASVFGDPQKLVPGVNIFYSFANPIIKWEAAAMTNFGFDMNLLNNRLQVSAEYYIKNQNDLLVQRKVPDIFGRSGDGSFPYVNLAKLQNRGFELTTTYKKMEGVFTYSANLTFTTIKNLVKEIPAELVSGNNITINDHTVGSIYGYVAERIVTPADFDTSGAYLYATQTGKIAPGDIKFKDINQDGMITARDRTIIGKSIPDMILGFGFDCYYKGFDFSIFLNGMFNYQVLNTQRASLCSFSGQDLNHNKLKEFVNNYYTVDNPTTEYVRADMNNENQNDRVSTWWVEDASFLRFRDIQFGYSLPTGLSQTLGIAKGRVYMSAANAFILTKYTGRDPEGGVSSNPIYSGTDDGTYPTPRTITFGIQVEF